METTNKARLCRLVGEMSEAEAADTLAQLLGSPAAPAIDAETGGYRESLEIEGHKVQELRSSSRHLQRQASRRSSSPPAALAISTSSPPPTGWESR